MSPDPLQKGNNPSFRDPLTRSGKGGQLNQRRDYGGSSASLRSRIIFVSLCLIPYLGFGIYLFVQGQQIPAIALLGAPLFIGLLFWFVIKNANE